MKISVIIPALNEEASIAAAIDSAWQAGADEVIVADGGSSDKTLEISQSMAARVVRSASGRAVQQNAGAENASGQTLVFLHADNQLSKAALRQLRAAIRDSDVEFGAFRQKIAAKGVIFRWLEKGNAWRVRWQGIAYGDQAIFIRQELFVSLGKFPDVKLLEDLLLSKRAKRMAWPMLLDGPVVIDARRWQRYGVFRQTLRNWMLLTAHRLGFSPDTLASFYRRHDTAG